MRYLLLLLPALLVAGETPAAHKTTAPNKPLAAVTVQKNFKESGSPTAPIKIEIYTDYECPACRALYLDTLPSLNADFVATGKVELLHRDFRLPQHQFSKVATRYANAAGMIGKFDIVVHQLFVSQPEWSQSGNVDAQVAKVLAPGDLVKVRDMVANDAKLDDTVNVDLAMGNQDRLNQTPTLVIVGKNGKRDVIGGAVPFGILKSYLDKKLAE